MDRLNESALLKTLQRGAASEGSGAGAAGWGAARTMGAATTAEGEVTLHTCIQNPEP